MGKKEATNILLVKVYNDMEAFPFWNDEAYAEEVAAFVVLGWKKKSELEPEMQEAIKEYL